MGDSDSPLFILLSVVPLLLIVISAAAALVAWRSRRRPAQIAVGVLLIILGPVSLLSAAGLLVSVGAAVLISVLGAALLIAACIAKDFD
jgi:hypothetical protein